MMRKRIGRAVFPVVARQALIIGTGIFMLVRPTLHLEDHFTLRDGQTTVENMIWPVEASRWHAGLSTAGWLPQPVPMGASQVVVRVKNKDSFSWEMAPWQKDDRRGPLAPGEEREIFRGSLGELAQKTISTSCLNDRARKLHAQLSIDTSVPGWEPVEFEVRWNRTHPDFLFPF